MNREKAKSLLESFVYDNYYYKEKLKEVESFKVDTENSLKRIQFLKQDNSAMHNLEQYVSNIFENQIQEENIILEILNKKQKIEMCIEKMEQPFKTVLYLRYIRFLSFDDIGQRMFYSTKRIYQLHASAIDAFVDVYNNHNPENMKEL